MRTPKRTHRLLIALALAVALLFTSCGSSDDSAPAAVESTIDPDTGESGSTQDESTPDASTQDASAPEVIDSTASTAAVSADSAYLDSYTVDDEQFDTMVSVVVEGGTRSVTANALPDHETGAFPNAGNPNTISAQDLSYSFTTEPVLTDSATAVRTTGVALNGVKFEPGTAETLTCSSGETYRIEALQEIYNLGLDFNNAHVQPTGEYHYHGASQLLIEAYETDEDLVHVGFAADGFLIYYSKSGAYESGYQLSTADRIGTECTASGPAGGSAIDIAGTSPDGTYTSDWIHTDSAGDLDACNGTTVDGEYLYLITDEYPFIGRCVYGEVDAAAGPGAGAGPGGAGPVGGADDGPDLSEAAATLGVGEDELVAALGGPPPDLAAAAETLGISVDELTAALPAPPG